MNKNFEIPSDFSVSRRSLKRDELEWLYETLSSNNYNKGENVLEFGGGVSTWAVFSALNPKIYVVVENFKPAINSIKINIPDVKIVDTTWDDIPKLTYDVVFVDGSSGCPVSIVDEAKRRGVKGDVFRKEAVIYAERLQSPDAIVILHDCMHHCENWRWPKDYLEEKGYVLLAKHRTKNLRIYQGK